MTSSVATILVLSIIVATEITIAIEVGLRPPSKRTFRTKPKTKK